MTAQSRRGRVPRRAWATVVTPRLRRRGRRPTPHRPPRRPLPPAGRHQQPDFVLVGRPAVDRRDDLAPIHDHDPVGHFEDLVEFSRDEQDGGPGIAQLDRLTMDELDAADVEAARRLVEDEQSSSPSNSRATTTFCWLPPDSVAAAPFADGVRMSYSLRSPRRVASIAASLRRIPRANGGR